MARIVLTTPEGQQVVELRPTNSLGRHPSNSIQLLDKIVSKEHCILELRGDRFVLRDLGSLNGTFVNRDRVQGEMYLSDGDEIALGSTRARFEEAHAAAAPASPAAQGAAGWGAEQQQAPQGNWQAQPQQPAPQVPGGQQPPPARGYQQQPAQPGHPAPAQAAAQQPSSLPATGRAAPPYGQQPAQPHQQAQQFPGQAAPPAPVAQPAAPAAQAQQPAQTPGGKPPPPPRRAATRAFSTAYLPPLARQTQVDENDADRQIGAEIAAEEHEFQPFNDIGGDPNQLRRDYERLRLSYELSRDIANERDTSKLLEQILKSIFRFIPAQRGVIFLRDEAGQLAPMASHRNDGSSDPISISTTILQKVVGDRTAVLTHDAAMDFAASKGKSMILNQIQSAIVAPMLYKEETLGVLWLDSKSLAQFQPKDLQLVTSVANQAAMFIEINILGKQVEAELLNRERLSRLLSPNVAERVISGLVEVKPGGTRTECTIYNSDIRGFTRMSEKTRPEEIVEMLNDYFEQMVDVIFRYEGTLDKFMGDGIMALFGAPVAQSHDAVRAVECALEQTEVLGRFNRGRLAHDKRPLGVGVGIHSGPVVAGYIGSSKALSYTVIGDVANTSARLCARAAAGQIVVSETTQSKISPRFECEELPPTKVKGKDQPLRLFNVIRANPQVQVPGGVEDSPTDADVRAATPS